MIDVYEIDIPALWRRMGDVSLRPGTYYATTPHVALSTSNTLGNGTGRFSPWSVHRTTKFTRIGAEITVAGQLGSTVRLGIYADDGTGYPGAIILDAGTIAGDSATPQEIAISQILAPGLYWVGGVVQDAPTTQPTLRTISADPTSQLPLSVSAIPGNLVPVVAFAGFGMAGALPSTWPTATPNLSSQAVRVFVKTA